jgi:hypothetical protein
MPRTAIIAASLMIAAVLTGCQTIFVMSEAELFFRRHPELRVHYTRFCTTDVELLKEQAFVRDANLREAAEFVRQRIGENDKAREELIAKRRMEEALYREEMNVIQTLTAALAVHGGQVYYFEREQPVPGSANEVAAETGYLILSGGEIKATAGVLRGTRTLQVVSQ